MKWPLSDASRQRWLRFRALRRGYLSAGILLGLIVFSLLAELFINNRALVVHYQGQWFFPTYGAQIPGRVFGFDYDYETDYRQLALRLNGAAAGGFVLLPPVPWNPLEQDFRPGAYPPGPPSLAQRHLLGTDSLGRDLLARLVYGFRIALGFAALTLVLSYAIGVTLGCLMGYLGGRFDLLLQRGIEIWSLVPFLYVIMILVSLTEPSFGLFVGINVLFGWMGITWYMRALTYRERSRDYVLAARALGAGMGRILLQHILPNTLVMILTLAPFTLVANISTLTALDYLGFGLPPPTPSWGELLAQGMRHLDSVWIVGSVVVAIALVLTMVAFVGEALREAFDPRRFSRYE